MKFEINNITWEIIEQDQEVIKSSLNERRASDDEKVKAKTPRYYGVTHIDDLQIILDKDLPEQRKRRTLLHELAHCYIASFITHEEKNYDEEMVADIVSNSHEIIGKIANDYFKKLED